MTTPPIIGMPSAMVSGRSSQYLASHYPDAVAAAGGIPVILPLLQTPDRFHPLLGRLDGILLPGSATDVDPMRYGADREAGCGPVQPLRDATDFYLLDHALEHCIPVLAICFGMQALNAFMGGTLIQDIPSRISTPINHSGAGKESTARHEALIVQESILDGLAPGLRVCVNSTHHQAVDRPGHDLEVIARAPDGIIEAVAYKPARPWILGLQWHPEKDYSTDDFSLSIFRLFLEQCRLTVQVK